MNLLHRTISLYREALALCFRPRANFARLQAMPESIRIVMTRWALPLVGLALVVDLLRAFIFGIGLPATSGGRNIELSYHPTFVEGLVLTLPLAVGAVVQVFISGALIYACARLFGGGRELRQAVRAAAYVATPAWLIAPFASRWSLLVDGVHPPHGIALLASAAGGLWLLPWALQSLSRILPGRRLAACTLVTAIAIALAWAGWTTVVYRVITAGYGAAAIEQEEDAEEERTPPPTTTRSKGLEENFDRCSADLPRIGTTARTPYEAYCLGLAHQFGVGRRPDPERALTWFRRAANQDYAPAQAAVGFMLEQGIGTRRDPAEAIRWYRRSAQQDDPDGWLNLGRAYELGVGVARDEARARQAYAKAAALGNTEGRQALDRLGR